MGDLATDKMNGIVEALIFAADEPISLKQIQEIVEDVKPAQIKKIIQDLNLAYKQSTRAFQIVEAAGGYQMVTREAYSGWLRKLFQRRIKSRLSHAALETLSVIAFRQPVSRTEVDAIRGVNSEGVVRTLLERKLITISGRADGPGRPLLYKTTREFLRYFGINDISDLPKPREMEELLKEEKDPDAEVQDLPDTPGISTITIESEKADTESQRADRIEKTPDSADSETAPDVKTDSNDTNQTGNGAEMAEPETGISGDKNTRSQLKPKEPDAA